MKTLKDLEQFAFTSSTMEATNLTRAKNLILSTFKTLSHQPKKVLSLNQNWAAKALEEQGLLIRYYNEIDNTERGFDTVLALDEATCNFKTETEQKIGIANILSLVGANGLVLFSLRDYRNGHFHKRPLGDTVVNSIDGEEFVTVEVNKLDPTDKQAWEQFLYVVKNGSEFYNIPCGDKRTLYFKQLANYCSTSGSTGFGVAKDIYWRGNWRRTPENIIWAKF